MKKLIVFLLFGALLTVVCSPYQSLAKQLDTEKSFVLKHNDLYVADATPALVFYPNIQLLAVIEYKEPVSKSFDNGYVKPVIRPPNYRICNAPV